MAAATKAKSKKGSDTPSTRRAYKVRIYPKPIRKRELPTRPAPERILFDWLESLCQLYNDAHEIRDRSYNAPIDAELAALDKLAPMERMKSYNRRFDYLSRQRYYLLQNLALDRLEADGVDVSKLRKETEDDSAADEKVWLTWIAQDDPKRLVRPTAAAPDQDDNEREDPESADADETEDPLKDRIRRMRHTIKHEIFAKYEGTAHESKSVARYDQSNWFTKIRQADVRPSRFNDVRPLQRVNSTAQRDVFARLDKAYQAFFGRCRLISEGKLSPTQAGYPQPRIRRKYSSITFPYYGNGIRIVDETGERLELDETGRLARASRNAKKKKALTQIGEEVLGRAYLDVTGIGLIRAVFHTPIIGKIRTVTIKEECRRWYAVISVAQEPIDGKPDPSKIQNTNPSLGMSLGPGYAFGTSSRGRLARVSAVAPLQKTLAKLQWFDERLAAKKSRAATGVNESTDPGNYVSGRYRKMREERRKHAARLARIRRDFQHKLARTLAERYGVIFYAKFGRTPQKDREEQRLARRPEGRKGRERRRQTADAGWYGFLQFLQYKMAERGGRLVEINLDAENALPLDEHVRARLILDRGVGQVGTRPPGRHDVPSPKTPVEGYRDRNTVAGKKSPKMQSGRSKRS